MYYMAQALALAWGALGSTSPNPAVGAVIVKDGQVVGLGQTQPPGGPHAEVVALAQAMERARGATMYVTLEPCCPPKAGRTPPCTEAIIASGIAAVHMAILDPNPLVSGRGRARLEEAGIETHRGEGEREARRLNEAYFKFMGGGLPFVTAKLAMSLDGKIATRSGDAYWITGPQARDYGHQLRARVDAILVGVNTVIADDPLLTARPGGQEAQHQPWRIVVDSRGRTPLQARLLKQRGRTIIATTEAIPQERARQLEGAGAEVWRLPAREERVALEALMAELRRKDVTSVLAEGGGAVAGSLFDLGLVDKVVAFIAPIIIGGAEATPAVAGRGVEVVARALRLREVEVERLEEDLLVTGYTKPPAPD